MNEDEVSSVLTSRLRLVAPAKENDPTMFTMFNNHEAMLPWLPSLCPMSAAAFANRRTRHRAEFIAKTSRFWDVVARDDGLIPGGTQGDLVGSSGFRTIDHAVGSAEWGVMIEIPFRRLGLCKEIFDASLIHARDVLQCKTVTAATAPNNTPVRLFFDKVGMKKVGQHEDDGGVWLEYEIDLSTYVS
eukprot:m.96784 g.96784  ORF g.96784 m.96784 type:complete len:187 (-) comp26924_c0_seq1:221-781(-)